MNEQLCYWALNKAGRKAKIDFKKIINVVSCLFWSFGDKQFYLDYPHSPLHC